MRKIAFNDGWTCRHAGDSGKGKPVTIPHDAMLDEKRTQESLGGINIGWFEGFDYVYEKEFSVPQEYEEDRKSTRLNSSHSDRSRMPSSA